jgi:hypothetical protein
MTNARNFEVEAVVDLIASRPLTANPAFAAVETAALDLWSHHVKNLDRDGVLRLLATATAFIATE